MINISKEDYIKAVFVSGGDNSDKVSTALLAAKLSVSNAATSEMAKKLDLEGLLTYEKYRGVKLTSKGRKEALRILRRHRLWETFLAKTLNISWADVHDEAEILEHQTSDFLVDKIDEFLEFPQFDPHGDPIPQKDGKIPLLPDCVKLNEAEQGKKYKVVKIAHSDKELMHYFIKIGISLDSMVDIKDRLNYDNSIFIKIGSKEHALSSKVASRIYVKVLG